MRPHSPSLLLVALCSLSMAAVAAAGPAPLAVYGQLPFMENVALSPDGTRFAFATTTANEETAVIVSAVSDLHQVAAVSAGAQKLRYISWADDDNLLINASSTALLADAGWGRQEYWQQYAFQVSTRQIRDLMNMPFDQSEGGHVYGYVLGAARARQVGNRTIAYVIGESAAPAISLGDSVWVESTLFKIPLGARSGTIVNRGASGSSEWLLDRDGSIVASEAHSGVTKDWSIKLGNPGAQRTVLAGNSALEYPSIEGIAPDGKSIWIETTIDGHNQWQSISLADGKLEGKVPDSEEYSGVLRERLSDRIVGVEIGDDFPRYRFFDPKISKAWETVYEAVAEMHPKLVSWSDDQLQLIVLLQAPGAGLRYVHVDLEQVKVVPIGTVYRGLATIAEVQRIDYPAGDGLVIPAYLTLPSGREAKNLPLVVLPHGGPESSDTAEFDWLPQALAAQGYAVLQPNFRGSSLSPKFVAAGYGQWGRKMQTDLSDGVRFLAGKGLVDPKRVCIAGGSYGGYAALAGAAFEPTVYRCAAAIAGISDLGRFLRHIKSESDAANSPAQQYWQRFLGVSGAGDAALGDLSPLSHVDAITVPVLLIHGRDDTVVPYEQSKLMADALARAHKHVTMVDLKKEDHHLSRSATRLQALESLVAFLQANNPS